MFEEARSGEGAATVSQSPAGVHVRRLNKPNSRLTMCVKCARTERERVLASIVELCAGLVGARPGLAELSWADVTWVGGPVLRSDSTSTSEAASADAQSRSTLDYSW